MMFTRTVVFTMALLLAGIGTAAAEDGAGGADSKPEGVEQTDAEVTAATDEGQEAPETTGGEETPGDDVDPAEVDVEPVEMDADATGPVRSSAGMIRGQLRSLRARFGSHGEVDREALRQRADEIAAEAEAVLGPEATPDQIRAFYRARTSGYESVEDMRADLGAVLGEDAGRGLVKAYLNLRRAAGMDGEVDEADYDRIRQLVADLGDDLNPGRLMRTLHRSKGRMDEDGHPGRGRGRHRHADDSDGSDADPPGAGEPTGDVTETAYGVGSSVADAAAEYGLPEDVVGEIAEHLAEAKARLADIEAKTGIDIPARDVVPDGVDKPEPDEKRRDDDHRRRGRGRNSDG